MSSRRGRLVVMVAVVVAALLACAGPGTGTGWGRSLASRAALGGPQRLPLEDQQAVRSQSDELLASAATAGLERHLARPPSDRPSVASGPPRRSAARTSADLDSLVDVRPGRGRSPPTL
ncbi:MAG TPA: hypothetical protein VGP90_02520 [Acidimicrobiia bacterium]|nr:hypothetical protein [Acidimicrobiia bacterium]